MCNKLSEVPPAMQKVAKGDFCAGCPAPAAGVPSLVPGVPFRLCCFLTTPYNNFFCYHLIAPPGLLGKIPIPFIFFVCVYIHTHTYIYVCVYTHSSILYMYIQCLHIGMYFKIMRSKCFTVKVPCLQMPRSP